MIHHAFWLFLHWTGSDNTSGAWYGFWSGFGSDIGEGAILLAIAKHYRAHKCARCWRFGRHPVEGTHYLTCHHHLTLADHGALQERHATKHPAQHWMLNGPEDR